MFGNSQAGRPARTVRFWLIVGVAVLLTALLVWSPSFQRFLNAALVWAEGVMNEHPVGGAAVFFVFSALSAMLAFASSTVLVPAASLAWGKAVTFLLLWAGWLTGAIAAFGIGRLARPLLAHTGYEDKLEKYQQYVSQRMKFWAVLLFCIAIPSEIPGYLFGSMRYPFPKFLAAVAIAELGYAFGVVIAGESLLRDKPMPFLIVIGLLMVVAAIAGLLLRQAKNRKLGGMPPH